MLLLYYYISCSGDLSDLKSIENFFDDLQKRHHGVDILVNNAGIQHVSSVENFKVSDWDRIISINLSAVFHTSRLSLPYMKEKNWGRIINVSSVHGMVLLQFVLCMID